MRRGGIIAARVVVAISSYPTPLLHLSIPVPDSGGLTQGCLAGLAGSMLVYLFSAFACSAVGRSAQAVVNEVCGPDALHRAQSFNPRSEPLTHSLLSSCDLLHTT